MAGDRNTTRNYDQQEDKTGKEAIHPPETTLKKEGVTSSFSSATGDAGKYSGEDISDVSGSTGNDEDKTANR